MSTALLDLSDRIITDAGSMVAKHDLLVSLALSREPFAHLPFAPHEDIQKYHKFKGTMNSAKEWKNDGIEVDPKPDTFTWTFPKTHQKIDVAEYCMARMVEMELDQDDAYMDRLASELIRVEEKQMDDFIRCLIWITDRLRKKGKVWGLGRGSSCASLIMFIIGVNKVDPVRYDIPMEEFYK